MKIDYHCSEGRNLDLKTIRNKTNQERIQPAQKSKINSSTPNCDSAIGTYLLKHPNCALHHNDNQFSILSKARSEFHLAVLESTGLSIGMGFHGIPMGIIPWDGMGWDSTHWKFSWDGMGQHTFVFAMGE